MSGALKAKIIVVVVLLALTAALVGTCIAYRNRACEHTSLEHIEAVEPTCTESGNIEHWACKRCGATFKDEAGAEEIGRVVIAALGHDLTRHSAVEPTCTEAGNVEYWECERCGVIFSDSAATKPLDDHIVAASGHDWNEPVWNWSDDYSKATAYFVCNKDSEHVESVTAKVTISSASATCTGSGRITYLAKAELDGKTYSDSEVVQSGALGHDWNVSEWIWSDDHTSVTAKFVCSRDPSHTREVTETEIVVNEDPATCLADGKTEYSVEIAFDGNTYSDTAVVTLPATGHNWSNPEWTWNGNYSAAEATFTCLNDPSHTETVNAVVTILSSSATCTEPGNTEYKAELSFNENVYTDSQSVSGEALGHDWTVSEWIWSKDYTSVTANFVCARDPSHTYEVTETEIVINEVSATCEKEGKTEYSGEIAFDGNTYSDTAVVTIPATGHNWGEPEWTWSEDSPEATATFTCLNDPSHTETLAAEVTIVDTTATCTMPGETGFMAKVTFNGKDHTDKQTVTGEALGHAWTVSEWIWSDDYTSVTANFVCARDPSHTDSVTATNIDINEVSATCEKDGKTEYSVEISFDGNTYSDTAVVTHPATGHDWSAPEWTWSEDSSEATATFTCQNDPSHTETLAAEVTIVDTTVATCTAPGETGFMAKVTFNGKDHTDKQTVINEALGHDWTVSEWIWSDDYTSVTAKFVCSRDNSHTRAISGQIKEDVIKPVSCTEDGESTFTATVSLDGEIYTDQKASVVFKAKGHVFSENWSADDVYHWHECTVCGEKRDISKHELVDFTCSVCHQTIFYTEGLEYTLSDDRESYLVSGIGTATDGDIKIMPRYDGKPVTGIADNAFKSNTEIDSVLIPDGVASIGANSFYGCRYLKTVVIPDSVKSIGRSAFYDCHGITRVDYSGDITGWLNIEGLDYLMDYVSSRCELYFGGTKVEGDIIIPEGMTSIAGAAFRYQTGITSVTIPDSVKSIGGSAFEGCSSLTSITIPDSVTSIGSSAFYGCSGFTSVTIPDSVTSIGQAAFRYCSGLTSVTIPDSVTRIGSYVFYGCSSLTSVTIPNSITIIEYDAFSYCSSLTSLTIPDSVTSIEYDAFSYCSSLTSLTIPDSVTSIGEDAFEGCINLIQKVDGVGYVDKWVVDCDSSVTAVNIRSDTVGIAGSAFSGCKTLQSVTIPDSVKSIGGEAFSGCSGLKSVIIGNGVTSIGGEAFSGCSSLTEVTIPDSLTSIGSSVFYNCSGLTSVTIPDSVTSIGSSAFSGCSSLTSVMIPDSVKSIGYRAFENCSSLTEVTIGNGVTSIGQAAFSYCSSLTSVTIPDSVKSIGYDAFEGCIALSTLKWNAVNVSGFDSSSNVFNGAGTGGNGISVTFGDSVESIPYNLFNIESYTTYPKIAGIKIGNNVKSIGFNAFRGVSSVSSVIIPISVESIESYAFSSINTIYCEAQSKPTNWSSNWADSSINVIWGYNNKDSAEFSYVVRNNKTYITEYKGSGTEVTIPDTLGGYKVVSFGEIFKNNTNITKVVIGNNVTSVFPYAFYGCSRLTSVTIPDSVKSIGNYAFYKCSSLTEVRIGNGVTSIGMYAFYNCSSLTSVTIPDSVTSIGGEAFYDCSRITIVDYSGDIAGWLNISGLYNLMYDVSSSCELYIGGAKVEGDIIIPEGVSSIPGSAFRYQTGITSVTIPDSVTRIGQNAFYGCSSLQSVTIGNGVTSIEWNAFRDCRSLQSVTIGNGVTSIDSWAFVGCYYITRVDYAGDISGWLNISGLNSLLGSSSCELYIGGTKVEELVIPDGVTSIPDSAFQNLKGITSVTIPDSVTSIGQSAFRNCSGLQSVTIGNGVTSIGSYAFEGCTAEIVWGDEPVITEIGDYAFAGYKGTSFVIPDSVTSIVWNAFSGCSGLQSVTIGNGVTSIGERAFENFSSLTEVTIGNGVTSIGDWAFSGCSSLTSVTIPDSVTSIGSYAFYNCTGLTEINWNAVSVVDFNSTDNVFYNAGTAGDGIDVTFGESVKIPAYLFYENDSSYRPNIKSVTIGNAVNSIGYGAFSGCSGIIRIDYSGDISGWLNIKGLNYLMEDVSSSLELYIGGTKVEELVILDGVTSIPSYAFQNLTGITSVTIPDSVTSIGRYAFSGCSGLQSVTIGTGVTSIGSYAFSGCSSLTSVTIPDSVTSIEWNAFSGCSGLTSITIPDSVTSIGWYAFENCSRLTEVTIPDSVTSIGSYAFRNCSGLQSVTIGNGVKSIGDYAFRNCSSLTSVTIPDSVTSIGVNAFAYCRSLTSVTIPDSVTSIGNLAFQYCSSLQSVTIGNGVTSIGDWAFSGCSSLTSATFKNTSGWSAGSTSLSSGNLADEYTAAQYLSSTYVTYTWTRR